MILNENDVPQICKSKSGRDEQGSESGGESERVERLSGRVQADSIHGGIHRHAASHSTR